MAVRRLVAVAVCVVLLGLSACSDDSDAGPQEPESSAPASSSPTATPSGPSIPPEARGTDEASAKAFVRHYFAVLSKAMVTGETTALEALSRPDCLSCRNLIEAFNDVYDSGGSFETTGWRVEKLSRAQAFSLATPDFLVNTRHTKRDLISADGEVVDSSASMMVEMRVVLSSSEGSWLVQTLEELK